MSEAHHFRRIAGAIADRWNKIPELCDTQGCRNKPKYRNRVWNGHVAFTCARHTPLEFRGNPIPEKDDP